MSVELPPPQVPQQLAPAAFPSEGRAAQTLTIEGRQWLIHGAPLDTDALTRAIDGAPTLADALNGLTAACFIAGYPAARVLYAESGAQVLVWVRPGSISAVQAPEALQPYFDGLAGADPLTAAAFEPRRVLASLHADRAGIYSVPHFVDDGHGGNVLQLNQDGSPSAHSASLELSNRGNRFAGRYFAEAELGAGTRWGDEFTVSWLEGLHDLDNDAVATSYHGPSASWERVTPYGIFGSHVSYASYEYTERRFGLFGGSAAESFKGEMLRPDLSWTFLPLADFDRRWSVVVQADYTDRSTQRAQTGEDVQKEAYPSVEVASSYARNFLIGTHSADAEAALTLRKGLGDQASGAIDSALDYWLMQPTLRLSYAWLPKLETQVNLTAQYSGDRLPQEEQFVLGGVDNLAAYLPGVAIGDTGVLASADLKYTHESDGLRWWPRAFVEYGAARYVKANAEYADRQEVADAGLELGMRVSRYVNASLVYAQSFHDRGISDDILDASDAKLYFRIKAGWLPSL